MHSVKAVALLFVCSLYISRADYYEDILGLENGNRIRDTSSGYAEIGTTGAPLGRIDRFGAAVTGSPANVTYGARIVAAVPKYGDAKTERIRNS
ncbi:hypothetical protein MAR_017102 [Mya arenaria]|uniref:Uncharacterized protein n=1 Tax=Mya arenaria TaxID=6604 RepID=A0ABY7EFE5_MYAAR|nr:hypothetical protein MAR_017102 [Mya arenaria]